jgi:hypothetical protein
MCGKGTHFDFMKSFLETGIENKSYILNEKYFIGSEISPKAKCAKPVFETCCLNF